MVNFPTKSGKYLVLYKSKPFSIESIIVLKNDEYIYTVLRRFGDMHEMIGVGFSSHVNKMGFDKNYSFEKLSELGDILYG